MAERLLPFAILFGSMTAFLTLSRRHELVVARAAGVSVWQFMMPALGLVFAIGVVSITIYNPIAAGLNGHYERLDARILKGRTGGILGNSESGLWLRQANRTGAAVIRASSAANQGLELFNVVAIEFDRGERFAARVEAERAVLIDGGGADADSGGFWRLENAWVTREDSHPAFTPTYEIGTYLSRTQIAESLASPTAIPFWDLPDFIEIAERAGLSAQRYRVHYQFLLAQPLLFCSMVLVAATFSLRLFRMGHVTRMVVSGILAGFVLFLANHVSRALGGGGTLPPVIAAWWPAVIAFLASLTVLFFQEDG
jgi:lipopolysaccharide export system permease protein